MAQLISLDKKNILVIRPTGYEQKEESWFSAEVKLIEKEKNLEKGSAAFHINDFVELINGIKSIKSNIHHSFIFDPIEPYLKMTLKAENNQYIADISFCKGPIFEESKYKKMKIIISEEKLNQFINQITFELKQIDAALKIKSVEL
ncbi:hypothetical protein KJ980_07170 [Patescibacteria group bacterium]|nr:hypothetical protein [Patescibacteria group bacterium]MBU4016975.1 hypothetical protein [Patescibacteria group bacterium]MBU4099402.1 hypothetical protein [Patescibacteria group bacterium]